MAEIKWIKIATDIFDDDKLLLIESGEDYERKMLIWIKLICLAGKNNNGGVFKMGDRPYTTRMFAIIFRMPEEVVIRAFDDFLDLGMIEITDGVVSIPNWDKHQSLDAYEKKKEYDRQYQAEKRAAKREEKNRTMSNDSSYEPSYDVVSRIEKNRIEENRLDENRLDENRSESVTEGEPRVFGEPFGSVRSPVGDGSAFADEPNKKVFDFYTAPPNPQTRGSTDGSVKNPHPQQKPQTWSKYPQKSPQKYQKKPESERCGSFDPIEAFEYALKRSEKGFDI